MPIVILPVQRAQLGANISSGRHDAAVGPHTRLPVRLITTSTANEPEMDPGHNPVRPHMAPAAVAALTLLVFLRTRVDPALAERLEAFRGDLYLEPWRLLTSLFVHELAPHLVFNLVTLWILGVRLTRSYGTLVFLALFLVGGTVGHAVHTLIGTGHVVGISGGVCALYGFLLVREWRGTWRSTARSWPMVWIYPAALVALAAADWLALLAIANVNHMIGIATGAMLAWAFSPARSTLWRVGSVAPVVACVLVTIYGPWDPVWRAVRGTYDSADLIRPIACDVEIDPPPPDVAAAPALVVVLLNAGDSPIAVEYVSSEGELVPTFATTSRARSFMPLRGSVWRVLSADRGCLLQFVAERDGVVRIE